MIEYSQSQNTDPGEGQDLSFKVIGVGGSGANVLDRLALEGSDDAQLLVLNTDIRKLSSSVSSQKIQLGASLLKGMGTGGDPNLGKKAAIEASEEIRDMIRGHDMVFVCVGLGGGTGSGSAPEVCRIAHEEGVFLVAYTTLPFEFEGARRMEQAKDALREIEGYANAVVTFDNDRMGELIVPKDGVTQAFAAADKIISQSIRATMNIVSKPGIIRIGMDDLLTALNSDNSRCLFGYGQAKGDNRALDAVDQTLKCPLLDNGKLLSNAKNVLIQVSGNDSMTLLEVQTVMKELTGHLTPSAHVLFGTGTDTRLGSSLAVTVISSLNGEEETAAGRPAVEEPGVAASAPIDQTPLAAAVTAAAIAAVGEATGIAASQEVSPAPQEVAAEAAPQEIAAEAPPLQIVQEEVAPQQVEQPAAEAPAPEVAPAVEVAPAAVAQPETNIVPISPEVGVMPAPAAAANDQVVAMPQFASEGPDPLMTNPIASAMQDASLQETVQTVVSNEPVELPPFVAEPQPAASQAPAAETADRVEAQTEQSQTIALSRIVPGETTQRIINRPPKEEGAVQPAASQVVTPMPTAEEQAQQQQDDILQLEPVEAKGRFAQGDPTIVDGEDLDIPTFLRKKG